MGRKNPFHIQATIPRSSFRIDRSCVVTFFFRPQSSLVIMSVFETTSTSSRGRRFSTWSNQFCPGQPHRYIAENDLLPVRPGQTEKDAFIHAGDDILSPPCFNWRPLELFLQRARLGDLTQNASGQASTLDLTGQRPCPRLSSMCLIDDRSSSSRQSEIPAHPQFEQQLDSKDGDYIHGSCLPQLGGTAFRKNLNEQELYHRLLEKVSPSCYPNNLVTTCASTRDRTFTPTDECCMYSH